MENYYSLSDIKSIMGDEGMGGGWFLIVILFLFLFGFGGMNGNRGCGPGYCGNDGYVTTSQFESENNFRTLDNSNRMTQTDCVSWATSRPILSTVRQHRLSAT